MDGVTFHGVKVPAELIVKQTELSCAIYLSNGYVPGHSVCFPKRQCSKQLDLTVDELVDLWQLASCIGGALPAVLPETTGISYVDAVDAGVRVAHLYLNVIPRKKDDFPSMFDIYDMSEVKPILPLALEEYSPEERLPTVDGVGLEIVDKLNPGIMTQRLTFESLPERPSFPQEEEEIIAFWRKNNTFQKSHALSKDRKPFTFFDGPPFATGLPHYGHILAGTIKDVVTRYAYQTGHHVERRFGWDCHGLPVEYEIDKKLEIRDRHDIISRIGIAEYNKHCRSIVMTYQKEWRRTVERAGRWIDFDNDYKTMNLPFMETVWWAFKELFKKGLVYRDFKVMPFSTACSTPLSNFEAGQNYKEVADPSVTICFKLLNDSATKKCEELNDVAVLAWTTTPWTLPSNMALCVHPEFEYAVVLVKATNKKYLVGIERFKQVFKEMKFSPSDIEAAQTGNNPKGLIILKKIKGADLVGLKYEPLFDFFSRDLYWKDRAWRIVSDTYVTADNGTGIVHNSPGFGEDDYRVCLKYGIIEKGGRLPCPVDESGRLVDPVDAPGLQGVYVKEADKKIKQLLKDQGVLLVNENFRHSYPHCWRSDTPLIYKGVPSWFVRVENIKDTLLANNGETNWVPKFVQLKRFQNWLADARDWCISRNRFWGTPLPLWVSEDYKQIVCIGSIEELQKYSSKPITDIHREFVDDITIPDPRGDQYPPLKRVEEVFDCWFESGCMPYAQVHYPFENSEKFAESFPADFVGEGLDQTRGWFYTLSVLGAGLFGKSPFKNLIVNGLVLAADGKKMSKRLQNYPPPEKIFDTFGSDALRLFLVSSPVVRAESVRFKEEGVHEIVKSIFLPWYHALRFMTQEVTRLEISNANYTWQPANIDPDDQEQQSKMNTMDKWILSLTQSLVKFMRHEMDEYRLYTTCSKLLSFLDQLTNWYVRLNRDRMRGMMENVENNMSLSVLFEVLCKTTLLMAPFTPIISEYCYKTLKAALKIEDSRYAESVHFLMLPEVNTVLISEELESEVTSLQTVINLGRTLRDRRKVPIRKPLKKLTVIASDPQKMAVIEHLGHYIRDELNVLETEFKVEKSRIQSTCLPNLPLLGQKYGSELKSMIPVIKALTTEELEKLTATGSLDLGNKTIVPDDVIIRRIPVGLSESDDLGIECDNTFLVTIDMEMSQELIELTICREVVTKIQKLRKEMGLKVENEVVTYIHADTDTSVSQILNNKKAQIEAMLRRPITFEKSKSLDNVTPLCSETFDVNSETFCLEFYPLN